MRECVYCETALSQAPPHEPGSGRRLAYDPHKGRLWEVCPGCERWNPVPLPLRWEALEACERAVHDHGRVLLSTDNLSLVRVGAGELIRIGEPPRLEFAGWRYGEAAGESPTRPSFWQRVLGALPPAPLGGYDPYGLQGMGGIGEQSNPREWTASPFLERASALTLAFGNVPLAPRCPSCGSPLALAPWEFQSVRFHQGAGATQVLTRCALCREEVELHPSEVRAGLRMGLAIVNAGKESRKLATPAARTLDEVGGAAGFVRALAKQEVSVGELGGRDRLALGIALDEEAEAEALEREWRDAEEIAAIMDGELTQVPGFEAFRKKVLRGREY